MDLALFSRCPADGPSGPCSTGELHMCMELVYGAFSSMHTCALGVYWWCVMQVKALFQGRQQHGVGVFTGRIVHTVARNNKEG